MQIWLRAEIREVIPPLFSRRVFRVCDSFLSSRFFYDLLRGVTRRAVHRLPEVHTCTTRLPPRGKVSAAASVMNN